MNMSGALKLQSMAVLIADHSRSSIFSQVRRPLVAGVVDHDVDAAERLQRLLDGALRCRRARRRRNGWGAPVRPATPPAPPSRGSCRDTASRRSRSPTAPSPRSRSPRGRGGRRWPCRCRGSLPLSARPCSWLSTSPSLVLRLAPLHEGAPRLLRVLGVVADLVRQPLELEVVCRGRGPGPAGWRASSSSCPAADPRRTRAPASRASGISSSGRGDLEDQPRLLRLGGVHDPVGGVELEGALRADVAGKQPAQRVEDADAERGVGHAEARVLRREAPRRTPPRGRALRPRTSR